MQTFTLEGIRSLVHGGSVRIDDRDGLNRPTNDFRDLDAPCKKNPGSALLGKVVSTSVSVGLRFDLAGTS